MGSFDTVNGVMQIKCTEEPTLTNYNLGDEIPLTDGAYITYEGCFVVSKGKVSATSSVIRDKWGMYLDPKEILDRNSPVVQQIETFKKRVKKLKKILNPKKRKGNGTK